MDLEYRANINGIEVTATYSDRAVETVFVPLLQKLAAMHDDKKRRILVMLAAPPGAGKSTLVSFLENLAAQIIPDKKVQAIGMDGFHRRQEYLVSHTCTVEGKELPMVEIKGAPITFDSDRLREKIKEVLGSKECKWPVYDRLLHNPVEDKITVDADIVLLEGNYLLADIEGFRDLADYADYTIFITADAEVLRKRLVERRISSGHVPSESEAFVDFSDMANVRVCLEKTVMADLVLGEDFMPV